MAAAGDEIGGCDAVDLWCWQWTDRAGNVKWRHCLLIIEFGQWRRLKSAQLIIIIIFVAAAAAAAAK